MSCPHSRLDFPQLRALGSDICPTAFRSRKGRSETKAVTGTQCAKRLECAVFRRFAQVLPDASRKRPNTAHSNASRRLLTIGPQHDAERLRLQERPGRTPLQGDRLSDMRLDAHQHFWKFDAADYPWIQADWPIRRDFLPDDLWPLLRQYEIEGCIAVQARQTLEETRWLLELAKQHPFIKGVVGWVDLRSDSIEKDLGQLAKDPKFVGVRHVVQDEPDDQFMLGPEFMRGIGCLKPFNLTYDLLITPRQLPVAIELVKAFPTQAFVVDHLAKPHIRQRSLSPWREQIREIANSPNVFCKISGMVTEADWALWQAADLEPYLDVVFDAFGGNRVMFGSDWPVCLLSSSYQGVFGVVENCLARMNESQRRGILGGNCARFYLQR